MKQAALPLLILAILGIGQVSLAEVILSDQIYREVPYSSQYSEDGALIRSVDFKSVNSLILQIEKQFKNMLRGRKLEDRNEAHITVITPPESKTGFFPGSIGIDQVLSNDDMIMKYKNSIQQTQFEILCVGMQKDSKGNIVFYLVVESDDILDIRRDIARLIKDARRPDIPYSAIKNYFPHITIGYVGGDVHGVSKGADTCVTDVRLSNKP